jgi:hypothetical protein
LQVSSVSERIEEQEEVEEVVAVEESERKIIV